MKTFSVSGVLSVWIHAWEVEAEDEDEAIQLAKDAGTLIIEPRSVGDSELSVYEIKDVSDDYGPE